MALIGHIIFQYSIIGLLLCITFVVLFLIKKLLIVECFVWIDIVSVFLILKNLLSCANILSMAVSKLDIWIWSVCRIDKVNEKGDGWVFIIVHTNLLFWLKQYILQVSIQILPLLTSDFYFCIYQISIFWSWNLPLGVLDMFLWEWSKLDMHIFSPLRLEEGYGKVVGCVIVLVSINCLILIKETIPSLICSLLYIPVH